MAIAIVVVLLLLSLYALWDAGLMFYIRRRGQSGYFTVDRVEHTIVAGRGKYAKKDGVARCDYILRIHYTNSRGKTVNTRVTARARMKIKNGHYLPFFHEKDQVKMKSVSIAPRLVFVDLSGVAERQGQLAPLLVWSFSVLLLAVLLCYLLIA